MNEVVKYINCHVAIYIGTCGLVAVTIYFTGPLDSLSENLGELYQRERIRLQDDQWPPNQPKVIVNLTLIHGEGQQTKWEFIKISPHKVSPLCSLNPRVTKAISEIMSPQKCILIEGAPGIGKTVLAQEIAYCWAIGEIFIGMKLFLLFVRDPDLHSVLSIDDLVHYLGDNYLSKCNVTAASDRLKETKGSNVVFVIDGYDECPQNCKLKGFIDQLYNRKFLPECTVVITSRPTASLSLRKSAGQRIEILGLAKREQDQYITKSLEGSPDHELKIDLLQEYLKHHPVINSLLCVPLNLAILLYLFKQRTLPETLTEMNEYFIIHTIYRHLTKKVGENPFLQISKITDLPDPELTIVYQLSKLAFEGLSKKQLIFTYDEIKEICPDVVYEMPGAINGFGLLQTVECYHQKCAGKTAIFNFLHLTMQEYLAALHISSLPNFHQSFLINQMLWNDFSFMWIMYIGIIGLESDHFTNLVNSTFSGHKHNKLAILFIFSCYLEGKDLSKIPRAVTSTFSDGDIDLSNVTLLPHSIMSLISFMMESSTEWKSLNLSGCYIGFEEIGNLTNFFIDFKETLSTIQYINLSNNFLTSLWETSTDMDDYPETALLLVKSLDLSCNVLNDNGTKKLFCALTSNEKLTKLNLAQNYISVNSTVNISDCLRINRTLQELDLSLNNITDEGAKNLAEAIQVNTMLQELNVSKNYLSKEGVMRIMEGCTNNKNRTLHKVVCTHNDLLRSELDAIVEYVKTKKSVQIFDASWNSVDTKNYAVAIKTNFHLLNLQQELQSDSNGNNIKEDLWCVDEITEQRTHILQHCFEEHLNNHSVVSLQNIRMNDFEIEILSNCLKKNTVVTNLDLSNTHGYTIFFNFPYKISSNALVLISDCLKDNRSLCKLNLSGNEIIDSDVKVLANAVSVNTTLQTLDMSYNSICDNGVSFFVEKCLVINHAISELNLSKNMITDNGAKELGRALQVNKTLKELDVCKNWISKVGIMEILKACAKNRTLHKLVCTHNNLSKSGLAAINEYIKKENAVQIFDASWNKIVASLGRLAIKTNFHLLDLEQNLELDDDHDRLKIWCINEIENLDYRREFVNCCFEDEQRIALQGIGHYSDAQNMRHYKHSDTANSYVIISYCVKVHKSLTEFTLSNCKITDKQVQMLAKAIEVQPTLQYFDISHNKITDNGIIFISDCLKINSTLHTINLAGNCITDSGAKCLTEAISINTTLKILNTPGISYNLVCDDGTLFFYNYLKNNETLNELNLSGNRITDKGMKKLGEAIRINKTLEVLNISENWIGYEDIMRMVEACTENKTLLKLVCTHNNLSKSELAAINEYNRKENAVQVLESSWNSIGTKDGKLAIETTFYLVDLQHQSGSDNVNVQKDMWYLDKITELNHKIQILHCCFVEHLNGQNISLRNIQISDFEIEILSECFKLNNTSLVDLNLSGSLQHCNLAARLTCIKHLNINSTLHSLDLSNNHISDVVVEVLTKSITISTTLQEINLSQNDISDNGIYFIYNCLKINNKLCELDLSRNNITDKGAKGLAKALQVNNVLQKLNISKNWISKEGVMEILEACAINKTLLELVCTHNNLSKTGFETLIEYIRKEDAIWIFNTSWNMICTKYSNLAILTTFELLDMTQNLHYDIWKQEELWFLCDIKNLEYRREILFCCIENEQTVNLQTIGMGEIEIFSDCLKMNNALIEIKLPNIKHIKRAEKLAKAIQVNNSLQILDISGNKIYSDGITALINCLKVNSTIRKLNISSNDISDDKTKYLAEVVRVNTVLQELNISKNRISKRGVMNILKASSCTKNRTLHKLVCTHNNLSKLGLADINKYIKKENAVQIFDASWNSIGIKSGKLAVNTTFLLLDLNQSKLELNVDIQKEWCVDEITQCYRREFLYCCFESDPCVSLHGVRMTDHFEMEIISDCLKTNVTLNELILSNNVITDEEMQKLSKAVKVNTTLQNLDISYNKITDVGILAIKDCLMENRVLCKMNLSKNYITDEGTKTLADAIQVNTRLQELHICKNLISKEGVMKIVEACTINGKLHKLVCTGNNISKSGLAAINKFIRKENAVQMFCASWNSVCTVHEKLYIKTTFQLLDVQQELQSDNNRNEELWCPDEITEPKHKKDFLQCCFEECLNEKTFNLQNTTMTDFEVEILSDCFQNNNCTLVELHLSYCFTDNDVTVMLAISNSLKSTSTLLTLNLSNNQITDSGIKYLSEALAINTTLQRLDMSYNIISDDGILYISDSLKLNESLHELILTKNNITNVGAKSLAEAIQVNTALQVLNISKNWISKEGVMRMLEACTKNKSLQKLVSTHNVLSKSALDAINEYLELNGAHILFEASWNSVYTKKGRLGVKTNYLCVDQELQPDLDEDNVEYYVNPECRRRWHLLLQCCFEEYLNNEIVNLQGIEINDFEIVILSDCLKGNTVVVDLNLSNFNKSNTKLDDILSISHCLKENKTLRKLNLSKNHITDKGVNHLAEALETNTTLQVLNISKNMISVEGVMRIVKACTKNRTLRKLVCTHNMLLKYQLFDINEYIEKEKIVRRFEASWNSICIKNGRLGVETTLKVLQLRDDSVYKASYYEGGFTETEYGNLEFLQCCYEYFNVLSVNLQNIVINEFEIVTLLLFSKINELTLLNCSCTIPNLLVAVISTYLKNNDTLSKLNISNNKIMHEEIKLISEAVSTNTTLKRLNLSHNVISDDGVFFFIKCLKINKTMNELDLSGNSITDAGAKMLAGIIPENTTLLELNISKNCISTEGVMDILKACAINRTLHTLVCTHNNLSKSGYMTIIEYIKNEKAVQIIKISWNTICVKEHKLAIETTIQLPNDKIQKELQYVDGITELTHKTQFLQCCFEECLNEQHSGVMTMDGFEIEILSDYYVKINDTLIEMTLSNRGLIKCCLNFSTVTVNTTLQKLDLSYCILSDDGILVISRCLKTNKTVQELNLAGNDFTDKGAKILAEAIQINTTLHELDVSENMITKEGVVRIVEACTKSPTLCKLLCTNNDLSKSELIAISECIRIKNAVQIFDSSWNGIVRMNNRLAIKTTFQLLDIQKSQCDSYVPDESTQYVYEISEQRYKKEHLYCCITDYLNESHVSLQNIQMNYFEIEIFSHCLKINTVLTELNLSDFQVFNADDCFESNDIVNFSDNCITDSIVKVLIEAINDNVTLRKLDLSHNIIFDNEFSFFNNCLKKNNTLHELNLSRNNITDKTIEGLAEVVQVNVTLQVLDISKNLISREGMLKILKACTKHKTLKKVICTHNNLSKSGLTDINEYIRKEKALQTFIASWNSLGTNLGKLTIKTTFQLLEDDNVDIHEEMWYLYEITKLEHRREFLQCCFESEQSVNIQGIGMAEFELISDCLYQNKTLKELTISKTKITDKEAGKLAKAIKMHKNLQVADISHNIITDNGILNIIDCVKNNWVLCKLNLSNNKITDEGAKRLAKAIQVNKRLQELNVSKNLISKEGVMSIVEACTKTGTLHKLVCTHNNLSRPGLVCINECIWGKKPVQIFEASWNSIGTTEDVGLVIITTFQLLDVKQNLLDDIKKESWYVDEITDVWHREKFLHCCFENERSINLQGICMTGYFEIITNYLKMNKTLIELNLSNCEIGKVAKKLAGAIKVNTVLQNLNISCNALYLSGIEEISSCLKTNNALTKLNVSENGIGDTGATCLAELIQVNKTLLELDISKNHIRDRGVVSIIEACKNNNTLNKLVCRYNDLSKSEFESINEYIEKENTVKVFDASWNSTIANHKFDCDTQIFTINIVAFRMLTLLANGDWETIFNKESEVYLVHDNERLGNRSIQYHFRHDSLTELNFLPNMLLSSVLLYLVQEVMQIETLQKLSISGNKISDDGAITFSKFFKTNTTLIELNLSGNSISCNGARAIAEVLQVNGTLQKLDMSHNEICDDGTIALSEGLKSNSTLVDLDVSWNYITCKGASAFGEALEVNDTLQKLDISDNKISDDGAIALSECLEANSTLIELKMSRNNISCEVADKKFYVNNALQKLDISSNKITDDGAIALSECLRANTTLIEVKMSGNNITLGIISAIAKSIEVNYSTLQKLDISNSKISDSGIIAFSKYLHISLTELDISGNDITCQGASAIAKFMRMNTTLQKLNISNNTISDNGAVAFSEFLKTDATLIELSMSANSITCKGARVIAEAMQINTTLQTFDISANEISDDGAMAFSKCLKINTTLSELNMSRDYFTRKGANAIAEAIQKNTSLKSLTLCNVGMKVSSSMDAHSFNMIILSAMCHNDNVTELTVSMPFSLMHDTALSDEFEKINNVRRERDVDLVKFNCIDEYY